MKNIIIIATACRTSGALTIYKQFLTHLKYCIGDNRYYIFVDPSMPKVIMDNVEFIEYDTQRYIDRILFDWKNCKKILQVKGIVADVVVSLQNTGVKCLDSHRTLIYYHQSIPFYPNKWNPFKKSERLLFYYKHVYPLFVRTSLNKKTDVVVQIPFVKKGFVKLFKFPLNKVHVLFPDIEKIDSDTIEPFDFKDQKYHLIYPATSYTYKNHIVIIEALRLIKMSNPTLLSRIVIHFTFNKDENPSIAGKVRCYQLDEVVSFDGQIEHGKLLTMCKSSKALLFPSEIETLGLPLIEAAQLGIPIIVSDMDYAKEVLVDYSGQYYVHPHDYLGWARAIENICMTDKEIIPLRQGAESSWTDFFRIINY